MVKCIALKKVYLGKNIEQGEVIELTEEQADRLGNLFRPVSSSQEVEVKVGMVEKPIKDRMLKRGKKK